MTDYQPVVVAAGDPPVTLAEFKQHCRIDSSDEDGVAAIYLAAASAYVGKWTGRQATNATWSQQFDGFCRTLRLSVSPVASISAVAYLDADGVSQVVTASNYAMVNGASGSPELRFIDDFSFPVVQDQAPVLTVTMVAGYDDEAPELPIIKAAVLLVGGDLYANREGQSESGMKPNAAVRMLLDLLRTKWMA